MTEPVIVELAENGATPRHRNRHVPRTPAEITEVALAGIAEPSGLPWSVAVPGGDVAGCGLAELAIRRGGHVRVGLEDYAGPGEPSNLDLLRALVAIAEGLGRAPATTAQARRILGVPFSRRRV